MKKFLSFTAVAYESEDVLGHTLAWCSLIPQVLLVVQTTAFILCESKSRQLQAGSLLTGQIINEVINVILKRILQQPRPSSRPSSSSLDLSHVFRLESIRLWNAIESCPICWFLLCGIYHTGDF